MEQVVARPAQSPPASGAVRVWDPFVRVFHWSLVCCFATAWLSEAGEDLHEITGYIVLGLVAFRILWGLVGSRHARFTDFVRSPATVMAYLRDLAKGRAPRFLGHNPAGGAMILALLAMVGLTSASGWLMVTDRYWGVVWVEVLHEWAADLTVLLILAHVVGVVVSSFLHRENLVAAMITGEKRGE